MKDYLVKFEHLYTKIKDHKMELPDGVLAYRILNSANLSNEQMTLCRATMTDLTYAEMVKQLKRLFAAAITSTPVGAQATYQPKEEPVFYNENDNSSVYYGDSRRKNWYRGNGGRNRRQNNPPRPKKGGNDMKGILNPVDRDGNITRCRTCDSKYQWQSECPVRLKTPEKITLFQSKNIDNEETKVFVGETINCAVLDSDCSQTVCGKKLVIVLSRELRLRFQNCRKSIQVYLQDWKWWSSTVHKEIFASSNDWETENRFRN